MKKDREAVRAEGDLEKQVGKDNDQLILGLMILEALVCAAPMLVAGALFFAGGWFSLIFLVLYYYFVFLAWGLALMNIFCLRAMRKRRMEGWRGALSLMTFSEIVLLGCVILATSGFDNFGFVWMTIFVGLGILGFVLTWFLSERYEALLERILMILSETTLVLNIVVLILTLISA